MKPEISVVIPMYNQKPRYLRECLTSVIKQTYPKENYEIIVVNDGSTNEDTLQELNIWKQKKIQNMRFIDKENGRTGSALNSGIKAMKGDWFMWISSDDIWMSDKIEKQMEFMKKNGGKIFYNDWLRVNAKGKLIRKEKEPEFKTQEDMIFHLCFRFFGCGSTIMIHKECFDKVGLFSEKLLMCEDYEMWFRLAKEYMFYKVPECLMKYRTHSDMLTKEPKGNEMYLKIVEWGREFVGYQDLVSVIVIAYNEEETIKKCIESVIQEVPYVNEIIVVDDCSTDKTPEIIKSIKKAPCEITLLQLKRNMGRGFAKMAGITKAKNRLVCTVDGDIILSKGWLEHLLKGIARVGGVDAYAGSVQWVSGQNVFWSDEINMIQTKIGKSAIGTVVTLFKKSVFDEIPIDVNLRDGEDTDLFLRLQKKGYLFYKDQQLIGKHVANMDLIEFLKRNHEYGKHRAMLWSRHKDLMGNIDPKEFDDNAQTIVTILENLRRLISLLGFKEYINELRSKEQFPKWGERK